ncbi:hypothetical protein [Thiocystis minor]|uniref:hypothetical protein n=1 Tax=Thiocystis minor TaxID=61597 RepID=UPI001912C45D|nr:hypothetical protein [Thiocystis minor]
MLEQLRVIGAQAKFAHESNRGVQRRLNDLVFLIELGKVFFEALLIIPPDQNILPFLDLYLEMRVGIFDCDHQFVFSLDGLKSGQTHRRHPLNIVHSNQSQQHQEHDCQQKEQN